MCRTRPREIDTARSFRSLASVTEEKEVRSRVHARWGNARPTVNCLTWGREVAGDNFIAKAAEYGVFGEGRTVLEVGGGYGRLLEAAIRREMPFARYVAIDISEQNVRHLRERFPDDAIRVVHSPVESVRLDEPIDSVISSLTFKHFYPSFEAALQNLEPQLTPGAVVVFDLIEQHVEGELNYWECSGTYTRRYTRPAIEAHLTASKLALVAFDQVTHDPGPTRLLVVAAKPRS
jgi:ubiquinone/menaquinone biosynthesis C-methylase UbiE